MDMSSLRSPDDPRANPLSVADDSLHAGLRYLMIAVPRLAGNAFVDVVRPTSRESSVSMRLQLAACRRICAHTPRGGAVHPSRADQLGSLTQQSSQLVAP